MTDHLTALSKLPEKWRRQAQQFRAEFPTSSDSKAFILNECADELDAALSSLSTQSEDLDFERCQFIYEDASIMESGVCGRSRYVHENFGFKHQFVAPQSETNESDCGHNTTITSTKLVLMCADCAELIEVFD